MYRRKPRGWLGHIDFMLLDMLSLVLAFLLACFARFGTSRWPSYYDIFVVYLLVVALLHIVNNTFSSVLKRGYYKEFTSTISHVATAELAVIMYLFMTKQGNDVSRIAMADFLWTARFVEKGSAQVGKSDRAGVLVCDYN